MPQHIFTGEGSPDYVVPSNPGDHYVDVAETPPTVYQAVPADGSLGWVRLATAIVENGDPYGAAPAGAIWVSAVGSIARRVAVGDGERWTQLASMTVNDTVPGNADDYVPGLYLNNQTGDLYINDGLGSWFTVPTSLVE
ncbi:hypothetical protein [Stutzerimonas stutzeri]|uniref:hypothetical protein n=1 Tax=Stutzerimonas stutzeri TaxID=316 RepID=UPI000F792498|nr:hypothetical protein [Stutzerimonas stutzeri]RRV80343.1 hypothetical protein EGI92_12195 [Stutzerimonas stutzeri]